MKRLAALTLAVSLLLPGGRRSVPGGVVVNLEDPLLAHVRTGGEL